MRFDLTLGLDDIIKMLDKKLSMLDAKVKVNDVIYDEDDEDDEKRNAYYRRKYYSKQYDELLSAIKILEYLVRLENE